MNASPILLPFQPWHIDHYTPDVIDRIGYDVTQIRKVAQSLVGRSISVVYGGRVIGIGMWLVEENTATVSVLMSDELRKRKIFLNREIKRWTGWLRENGVRKIKASSCVEKGKKWLEFLGFKPTGETKDINGIMVDIYVKEIG